MPRLWRQFGRTTEPRRRDFTWYCIICWTILATTACWAAEPSFRDEMDGTRPVLQLWKSERFNLVDQNIDRSTKGLSGGVEVIRIQGPAGESAQVVFDLPSAPVIDELQLAAMVRCSRPGVQIAARVVLPRTIDSRTGDHHEILLRGGNIGRGLLGEKLVLDQLPKLLERQARVARLQTADQIDEREAIVSQLVFLVPGGAGITEFGVDWIEIYGVLQDHKVDPNVELASSESELFDGPLIPGLPTEQSVTADLPNNERIVDESTTHRIVEWHGESFELLARMGFNAVWLPEAPTVEHLAAANKIGMKLICPPPCAEVLKRDGVTGAWSPVLAWDLGQLIARDDLQQVERLKDLIRQHDPIPSRLTVMRCEQLSRDASRTTDAIVLGREVLGTDLTLQDYVTWIGQRQRIARPGTPIWATVESQLAPLRAQQAATLRGSANEPAQSASYDQLVAMTVAAMSVRCRDYVFTSHASLAERDAVTQQRARNLELVNLRLQLLAPWLATGKVAGSGRSTASGLSAMVFQAERSHLLVPIWWSRDFRSQQSLFVEGPVDFIVPGVAEATDVYLLTLAGTKRLRHQRTTGGLQVSVESLPSDGLIMLTSDTQAFSQVSQYLRKISGRASRLHRDAVVQRLDDIEKAAAGLAAGSSGSRTVTELLDRAKQSVAICDRDLRSGHSELSYSRQCTADKLLSQAEYVLRNNNSPGVSLATPLEFHVSTLDDDQRLKKSLSSSSGDHKLTGGDFENLAALLQAGWRHQQLPLPGITSAVRLSPHLPHQGSYSLELEARAIDLNAPVTVVSTPPVWISSPPLEIHAGELVEISGFARVEEELIGTVDGLQIIDSLGGPGMATRIKLARSWQPFRIIRAAPEDTKLLISVALSGLGRAQVDDLTIRPLRLSGPVARTPTTEVR